MLPGILVQVFFGVIGGFVSTYQPLPVSFLHVSC
jgi:hypothetical protein